MRRKQLTPSSMVAKLGMAAALSVCLFAHAETAQPIGAPAVAGVSVAGDPGLILAQSSAATQAGHSRNGGDSKAPASAANKLGNRLTWFFGIGMLINVVVLGAFLVWAFKQWKRT